MRFLVTAGPTREPIDAVRFISNRSSGKMGLAIAQAGLAGGHEVTLLHGPGVLPGEFEQTFAKFPGELPGELPGAGVQCAGFETTRQLHALLEKYWPNHDCLVMAAAVADYQMPLGSVDASLKKLPRGKGLTLTLEPTEDLVAAMVKIKRADQRIVAFALEEAKNLQGRALKKLKRKDVDAIVANPLQTMNADIIEALWLTADGGCQSFASQSKEDFATQLIACCEKL